MDESGSGKKRKSDEHSVHEPGGAVPEDADGGRATENRSARQARVRDGLWVPCVADDDVANGAEKKQQHDPPP
jgi:hypothetical protein